MADLVSPIVHAGSSIYNFVAKPVNKIRNLKRDAHTLEEDMRLLEAVYEDAKGRVEREERLPRKRTNQVAGWLDRVQRMEAEVSEILKEGKEQEQKKYAIFSKYKVGKRVSKMIDDVGKLREEGNFDVLTEVVRVTVNEKPMDETVGLDSMVDEVWGYIEDADLRIIGLYGLAGVGKTTLLKQINNEFLNLNRSSHGFAAVIWVSVSKELDLEKIQDEILRRLQVPVEGWQSMNKERKAETICYNLNKIKIVLLLDGLWERLDLVELGVISRDCDQAMQRGPKVVFTTRTLDICGEMEAQRKIKVGFLPLEHARPLFRKMVGEDTLKLPGISELEENMVAMCEGWPLALVTIGRTMASWKTKAEWEHAINILRNSPSQFPGMNAILLLLKANFDTLQDNTQKSCFLYCSKFEDCNIRKQELIEGWSGEVFLDESVGSSNVPNNGEYIIGSLKRVCLLENGESEEFVRMHPLIRVLALEELRKDQNLSKTRKLGWSFVNPRIQIGKLARFSVNPRRQNISNLTRS